MSSLRNSHYFLCIRENAEKNMSNHLTVPNIFLIFRYFLYILIWFNNLYYSDTPTHTNTHTQKKTYVCARRCRLYADLMQGVVKSLKRNVSFSPAHSLALTHTHTHFTHYPTFTYTHTHTLFLSFNLFCLNLLPLSQISSMPRNKKRLVLAPHGNIFVKWT